MQFYILLIENQIFLVLTDFLFSLMLSIVTLSVIVINNTQNPQ